MDKRKECGMCGNRMSEMIIKPLTPNLRAEVLSELDRQDLELKTCSNNAFVNVQLVANKAVRNLFRALPDGYPIPLERK